MSTVYEKAAGYGTAAVADAIVIVAVPSLPPKQVTGVCVKLPVVAQTTVFKGIDKGVVTVFGKITPPTGNIVVYALNGVVAPQG